MNKVILWSGGFDSTCLLLQACENFSSDDKLIVISIVCSACGEEKNFKESNARKQIKSYLAKKYPSIANDIIYKEIKVDFDILPNSQNNEGLSQPVIWSTAMTPVIPDNSEIQFGYIAQDQAFAFVNEIQTLVKTASIIEGKNLSVAFPLRLYTKANILEYYIISSNESLLDMCISCESFIEIDSRCGYCTPCKHLQSALIDLVLHRNEDISNIALNKLKEWFSLNVNIDYITKTENHELKFLDK